MKKIFKTIINLFLCISFISLNLLINYKLTLKPFNKNNIINTIDYLASNQLKGRFAGSDENITAGNYIKNTFQINKISPYNGSYLSPFQVYAPVEISGKPYLRVINEKEQIIAEYKYDSDFKESSLNFRSNSISFSHKDKINIYPKSFEIIQDGKSFVFYSARLNDFTFKSSFMYDSKSELYTAVTPSIFDALIGYYKKGYTISCFFPYEVEKVTINNVVGVIKGTNSKLPPLVLSSHYDHLGQDLNKTIYRGALDNASGTAFIIELGSYLRSLPPPERDIILVSFNAEEFGLLGSKDFVKKNKDVLKDGMVINFDMIGSDYQVPLSLMGGKNPTRNSTLLSDIQGFCTDNRILHRLDFEDASDHASFIDEGIDAVTLSDGDMKRIHTPEDKPEFISKTAIDRAYEVAWGQIKPYCYSYYPFILYHWECIAINGIMCIFFSILAITIKSQKY